MKSQHSMILCRTGSWLLIYLSIALSCWLFAERDQVFHFYGDAEIFSGAAVSVIIIGVLILGVCLLIASGTFYYVRGFIAGLVTEMLLLMILLSEEGFLGSLLLLVFPALPYLFILKIIQEIAGIMIPMPIGFGLLLLFQLLLIRIYFKRVKKLHWGFIASKLAVISVYALFCFYTDSIGTGMLSFFGMLNLIWLAEIPWIWMDTPEKPKR